MRRLWRLLALALLGPTLPAPVAAEPLAERLASAPAPVLRRAGLPHRLIQLNCGTLEPPAPWLTLGEGGLLGTGRFVTRCWLIETNQGLVLVDTGFGLADIASPHERFNWSWRTFMRPRLAPEESARHQLEQLGYAASAVTDIVLTHLDQDHAGGLADFPAARVHLAAQELAQADRMSHQAARRWAHRPRWVPRRLDGAPWRGLASEPLAPGLEPEVRLVALPGHTPGHLGVAVRQGDRWWLHAGDAYYHHAEVREPERRCPPGLELVECIHGGNAAAWRRTQDALRALARDPAVTIVSAHDPGEWAASEAEALQLKAWLASAGREAGERMFSQSSVR